MFSLAKFFLLVFYGYTLPIPKKECEVYVYVNPLEQSRREIST